MKLKVGDVIVPSVDNAEGVGEIVKVYKNGKLRINWDNGAYANNCYTDELSPYYRKLTKLELALR